MLVEVGAKQDHPSEQVEDVLLAQELTTGFGFGKHAVELVQAPVSDHVQVRTDFVPLRVAHEVDIQSLRPQEDSGFYIRWHGVDI